MSEANSFARNQTASGSSLPDRRCASRISTASRESNLNMVRRPPGPLRGSSLGGWPRERFGSAMSAFCTFVPPVTGGRRVGAVMLPRPPERRGSPGEHERRRNLPQRQAAITEIGDARDRPLFDFVANKADAVVADPPAVRHVADPLAARALVLESRRRALADLVLLEFGERRDRLVSIRSRLTLPRGGRIARGVARLAVFCLLSVAKNQRSARFRLQPTSGCRKVAFPARPYLAATLASERDCCVEWGGDGLKVPWPEVLETHIQSVHRHSHNAKGLTRGFAHHY